MGPENCTNQDPLSTPLLHCKNKKALGVSAKCLLFLPILVGANGLEPSTPTMSRWCSNQLSYAPRKPQILTTSRGVRAHLAGANQSAPQQANDSEREHFGIDASIGQHVACGLGFFA